ncbi:MAG: hypothetical protein KAT43_05965, partial [Nanoarchaeota archaeon]|nr:hypothetical protein [Nanoarchaeota archaeon]
ADTSSVDGELGTLAFIDEDDSLFFTTEGFRWQQNDYDTNAQWFNWTNMADYRALVRQNMTALLKLNATDTINITDSTWNLSYSNVSLYIDPEDIIIENSTVIQNQSNATGYLLFNATRMQIINSSKILGNVNITVINLTIDATSLINATGYGYFGGKTAQASGSGLGGGVFSGSGSGAGHGGRGGKGATTTAYGGTFYGSSFEPNTFGSGGGAGNSILIGGDGGGVVKIIATDTFVFNGIIESEGTKGTDALVNDRPGGGAGGSIWVITNTLSGSGNFSANGGIGGNETDAGIDNGGSGGGGRIAVYYNTTTFTTADFINSKVIGGPDQDGLEGPGEPGTIAFIDEDDDHLYLPTSFRFQGNDGPVRSFGNITAFNGSIIEHNGTNLTVNVADKFFADNTTWLIRDNNTDIKINASEFYFRNSTYNFSIGVSAGRCDIILRILFTDIGTIYANSTRITFTNESSGQLAFTSGFNNTNDATAFNLSLSKHMHVRSNSIFINSTLIPGANQSANMTFYGVGLENPDPYVAFDDLTFAACTAPQCYEISYVGTTFVFNASSFTTYQLQGGPAPPDTSEVVLNSSDTLNNTGSNLTCWVNATADTSNITVYFKWYNNSVEETSLAGEINVNASNLTLVSTLDSANTTKGENWTCSVLGYDGSNNESDWNNASLIIVNTVPTHTTPILNSSLGTNTTAENLTVYNQSTFDADDDPVKNIINWYKNGTSITTLNMPFEAWGGNGTHNESNWTKDYTPYGNNGTVINATWNATAGYDGFGAYEFDGVGDYIDAGSAGSLNVQDDFTIAAWVKTTSTTSCSGTPQCTIVSKKDAGSPYVGYSMRINANVIKINLNHTADNWKAGTSDVGSGWHHVVWTFNGSNSTIYVDGNVDASYIMTKTTTPTSNLFIGKSAFDTTPFNGTIDEVMIYNRSLSAEQIWALYQNRTDLIVANETQVNDTWYACITPNDQDPDGVENCSNNVTIGAAAAAVDLYVNASLIFFNDTNPDEGENITINATISNLEGDSATNVIVQFFEGGNETTGTQINGNITINISGSSAVVVNITHNAPIGNNTITVVVDPPTATNGLITEFNESNNVAAVQLHAKAYHIFWGQISGNISLADASGDTMYSWTVASPKGVIYVADSDSGINFLTLQALGKNTTGANATTDFSDADANLNMTDFNDSISLLWTGSNGSVANFTKTFNLTTILIDDVPIINTTNESSFVTGIVWDYSDDTSDGEYDTSDREDLLFITNISNNAPSQYGAIDYEIRIPALLRAYDSGTSSVTFYVELE